jgi:hypothetical protein
MLDISSRVTGQGSGSGRGNARDTVFLNFKARIIGLANWCSIVVNEVRQVKHIETRLQYYVGLCCLTLTRALPIYRNTQRRIITVYSEPMASI